MLPKIDLAGNQGKRLAMNITDTLSAYWQAVASAVCFGNKNYVIALAGVLYSRLVLRIGPFYYSLFSFYRTPMKGWVGFILDTEANRKVRLIHSVSAKRMVTNKLEFYLRLKACDVPTIPIISVISQESKYATTNGVSILSNGNDFSRVAQSYPNSVFFKIMNGAHGTDAFAANRCDSRWTFDGRSGTSMDLFEYCLRRLGDRPGWLIQPRICPHAKIAAALSPRALGTVRIVTALNKDVVRFFFAVLKIPVGENVTDNFSEGTSGNIIAPIDLESGLLGLGVISRSRTWPEMTSINQHPDTGSPICGFQLPFWRETLETVRCAQQELREAPTLGWDIAITDSGPVVVEANISYGVEIHQVALQRGLRKELSIILNLGRNYRE
jgi:hypothetical protein